MRFTKQVVLASTLTCLLVVGATVGSAQQSSVGASANSLEPLPRDLETKLALSALPPYLRADATLYVLDPTRGYVMARKGTNDFTCFVERTDWVREDYRNDLLIPECFDAEGTRTIVPVSFDVARLRAEGKLTAHELKGEITRRFQDGSYHSPARPGLSYMLSPVQRLYGGPTSKETRTVNMPHFMFYAPNLTSKDIGGGPVMGRYPYLVNPGPHAYMIVNVGETEKAQINQEESDLLKEVCAYRAAFCLRERSQMGQVH
jgi:hypothetical protein